MWSPLATASLVFGLLYFCLFIFLSTLFARKKVAWKSRWLVLLLHVLVRLASQACGLSFGVIGYRNIDLLVAYYILGAEGYFTLVVCTARFLIAWQRNHWSGYSWMEPVDPTSEQGGWKRRFKGLYSWKGQMPALALVDWMLIAANAIIISGGSLSSAAYTDKDLSPSQARSRLNASKAMRAAGQAIFLAVNTALLGCLAATIHQHRHHRHDHKTAQIGDTPRDEKVEEEPNASSRPRRWYAHPTLLLLLLTWPFLAVRGGFGVAQALLPDLNYFNSEVYDANGLTQQFVIEETCFVTMMEWISAAILASTYFTTRSRPAASARV